MEAYSTRWAAMWELLGVMGLMVNGRDTDNGRRARPREDPLKPAIAAVDAIITLTMVRHPANQIKRCDQVKGPTGVQKPQMNMYTHDVLPHDTRNSHHCK